MAKEFRYSPANPIRFVPQLTRDPRYNTLPFDQQPGKCYKQPWKTVDTTKIQILSDWLPEVTVWNAITGVLFTTLAPVIAPNGIQASAYTFICYEYLIDFTTIPVGIYYLKIEYTDDNLQLHTLISSFQNVQIEQPNTLLYEYRNSSNILSVLFDTGITFQIRAEGGKDDKFQPKFDAVIYSDQERDLTKLNSVPFESFILTVGDAPGVPDWMGYIFNFVFSCDFILIDGVPYQNVDGSKWEVTRPDPQSKSKRETLAVYSIEVMMTDNAFLERLRTGNTNMAGFKLIFDTYPKIAIGTNFSVPAIFLKYFRLDSVSVIKRGINFTMRIGITPGGNEIYQGTFTRSKTAQFNYLFDASATVFVSGLTGTDNDIFLTYANLNAIAGGGTGPVPISYSLPPGLEAYYSEVNAGDMANDWDFVTGLGKPGGNYPNCAIRDGRNGTTADGGLFTVGYLDGDATFGTVGASVGRNAINITSASQLPPHSFTFRVSENGTGNGSRQNAGWSDNESAAVGSQSTNVIGTSADIPFLPGSVVKLPFKVLS
jgi:hypothetical protein